MAKLRLLQHMKNTLRANAEQHIKPEGLQQSYDAAYKAAVPVVTAAVTAKFKPDEMAVLHKFECARRTNRVRVLYPNGVVQQFDYANGTKDEELPFVPASDKFHYGNGSVYPLNEKGAVLVEAWHVARSTLQTEYTKRRLAYAALIEGATYLEDLLGVWPEAAAIIPKTGGAIIALGPDQIETIKRDLEERRAKEEKPSGKAK